MRLLPGIILLARCLADSSTLIPRSPNGDHLDSSTSHGRRKNKTVLYLDEDLVTFKTEPKFAPVAFDIIRQAKDESTIAPGYLFFTVGMKGGHVSRGAQIMDQKGMLIWHSKRSGRQNLHVCDFMGHTGSHLCIHEQTEERAVILDNTYARVSPEYPSDNGHEMRTIHNGTSLLRVVNEIKQHDLTPYTGNKEGWVIDTCLEETDVLTGRKIFRWCPLDHLHIWESTLYMILEEPFGEENSTIAAKKAGKGTKEEPWDFFHANSADKYDGDYLLVGRHCDVILKIAGLENRHGVKPGTLLWRLGGRLSDFKQDFNFTRQHHIRFQSVTATETIVSIFNNGWEGDIEPSVNASDGQIIKINNQTMKATLLKSYPHPDGVISEGRGNTQVLPNGNIFNAFGRFPDIVEHRPNGKVVQHIRYSQWDFDRSPDIRYHKGTYSYRVFKQPWVGKPRHPPKLLPYQRKCRLSKKSPLIAYVSWNGATEVKRWRFHIRAGLGDGPWVWVGSFKKKGFETRVDLTKGIHAKVIPFVSVEALDAHGKVLGSAVSRTFVPKSRDDLECDKFGCQKPKKFHYHARDGRICEVETSSTPLRSLISFILFLEGVSYLIGFVLYCASEGVSGDFSPGYDEVTGEHYSDKEEGASLISKQNGARSSGNNENKAEYNPG